MRTLLIAPSFMAVFTIAALSIGWLIMVGGDNTLPDFSAMPSRDAFTSWTEQLPFEKPSGTAISEQAREKLDELGMF